MRGRVREEIFSSVSGAGYGGVGMHAAAKGYRWLISGAGLLSSTIGQTSIVNTFCHPRTPMIFIDIAYHLLIGCSGIVLGDCLYSRFACTYQGAKKS